VTLISSTLRVAVTERARHRCEYCLLSQESQVATFPVDHVFPTVLGGETLLDNLALACPRCNAGKWTRLEALDPVSSEVVRLFNPRTDGWSTHFRWSATDSVILEALTPTGRATLSLLDMNAPPHLSVRRLLRTLGLHPPA
jgi:hypothetical protein